MSVLADTSVWVEFLRRGAQGSASDLAGLIRQGQVVVCGPVIAELLAAPSSRNLDLEIVLGDLPYAELDRLAWVEVGRAARALIAEGQAVALTDIEIAVASIRGDSQLWTRDADFGRIASVLPAMRLYQPLD